MFGSALREDFRLDSDLDLPVRFAPEADWSLLDHVEMEEELAGVVGRRVDLVSQRAIERSSNWVRRKAILEARSHTLPRDDAYLLDILKAARPGHRVQRTRGEARGDAILLPNLGRETVHHVHLLIQREKARRITTASAARSSTVRSPSRRSMSPFANTVSL